MLSKDIISFIETAPTKALASIGRADVNVIPVSMIKPHEDTIWLFYFFMEKTIVNITSNPAVALALWKNMEGIQIKAEVTYVTQGKEFDDAVTWVQSQNPTRVVRGLLILKPIQIFDISPGGHFSPEDLSV